MPFYWKCNDCDEVNNYSQTKICETCGANIPASEERRIQKEIKLAKEREEQERIERKRREEAERKRKLEERLKRLEQERLIKIAENRKKTTSAIRMSCKVPSIVVRSLLGVAVVASIIICIVNASNLKFDAIPQNVLSNISTEFDAHMDVIEVEKKTDNTTNNAENEKSDVNSQSEKQTEKQKIPHFANNIREEFKYLSENFHPIDNFKAFFERVGNIFSGG